VPDTPRHEAAAAHAQVSLSLIPTVAERDATTSSPPSPVPARRQRRARLAQVPLPPDFEVSPAIDRMCRDEGLPDPYEVLEKDFRTWAQAKGALMADWEAAFRRWLRDRRTMDKFGPWLPPTPAAPRSAQPKKLVLTEEQRRESHALSLKLAGLDAVLAKRFVS
jgi:hypothetical protein